VAPPLSRQPVILVWRGSCSRNETTSYPAQCEESCLRSRQGGPRSSDATKTRDWASIAHEREFVRTGDQEG
jgi:hypothetical protein